MPLGDIDSVKDAEITYLPLLLAVFTWPDSTVFRASTHPLSASEGGFPYDGDNYAGRIESYSLGAIQGMWEGGIDIVPRVSVTLADADKVLLTTYELAKGFKGVELQLKFIFWEANTENFSSDWTYPFRGICDPAQDDETTISVTATNKLNLQRRSLPSVPLQRRCPWHFPTTLAQREAAADDEDSIFFRCGYSPDVDSPNARGNFETAEVPYTTCEYTKAACVARGMYTTDSEARLTGRFGGIQWDPPAGSRSREYVSGDYLDIRNNPNEAKYGNPIPMVYGTAWVDAIVCNVLGDGNSTRGEAIVCLGEVENIIKVVVNDVELQPATDVTGTVNYIVRDPLLRYNVINQGDRSGVPTADALFDSKGDPYGSMCMIEWCVLRKVADSASTPRVRVLVKGPKLRVYSVDEEDAIVHTRQYTENNSWVLMDVLIQAGFEYADLDLQSFIDFAAICSEAVLYVDQYGDDASHARFACSFVLRQRRSAADIIRALRQSCGAMLLHNTDTGLLEVFHAGTLASQQPAPVPGSNYNTAVASVSLAGAETDGYLAYDFTKFLRRNGRSSLRLVTSPNDSAPNRVAFGFINSERDWAADSISISDTQAVALIEREIDHQLDAEGVNTLDQAKRICNRYLAEQNRGNGRNDPGGTEIWEFEYSVGAVRVRAGHIVRLSDEHRGLENALARVLQVRPATDYRTAQYVVQRHKDIWYTDEYGQEGPDSEASAQYRNRLERPSFPWGPRKEQPPVGDPMYARTDWTFRLEEIHDTAADGTGIAKVRVTGRFPVNMTSATAPPMIGRQGTTATTGGTIAGGGWVYFYVVCAKGPDDKLSAPSITCQIAIIVPGAENTATIPVLGWSEDTTGYAVFGGTSPNRLTFQVEADFLPGAGPDSIELLDFLEADYGVPDIEFDRMRVKVKRIVHSGVFGVALSSVGVGTLTVLEAGWTASQWIDYDVTVISKRDLNALGVLNFRVTANTVDTLTVTPDPDALGVDSEDVIVMRSLPVVGSDVDGNYIEDALWMNTLSNEGNGLAVNEERGRLLRVISGRGRGFVYRITGNTSTRIWIEGDWITAPDSTSRYVVEEPEWQVIQSTGSLNNADPVAEISTDAEIYNYVRTTLLVEALTVDGGDNESFQTLNPVREIYFYGAPPSVHTVTDDYDVVFSDRTILADATDGPFTITLLPSALMRGLELTIKRINTGANAVTVAAADGEEIEGSPLIALTDANPILVLVANVE